MATKKIKELNAATTANDTDVMIIENAVETQYISFANLSSAIKSNINGAVTTILDSDLTAEKALVSNAAGKIGVSTVTSAELDYLSGATANLQGQLNQLTETLDNVSGSGVYASDSTEAPPIDIALNADTLGGQGPSYYAKQSGLNMQSADGTHCTVYYNDAIVLISFTASGLTIGGTTDTTTFALPQGYSLSGSNYVTTCALSSSWWPTANNVYITVSGSSVSMRAVQSATGAVVVCSMIVPRSRLTIS
ncbi:hypothetical protein [Hominifimenecus sp. rT4P-3]|uniref:hypothetical protein n=1 Tax=Hominifimenecus sp. rT4P-3 TaxID=3242979 RepID=UPI003DA4E7A0